MSIFTQVKGQRVPKTKFDLSHEKKLSAKMGNIYPIYTQEIMPGDSFKVSSEVMIRFAPLIAPVMERMYANVHYFFVPHRLVWDDWQDFITGGENGTLEPEFPFKTISQANIDFYGKGTLSDYLGVPSLNLNGQTPPVVGWSKEISALPYRAYALIYNEYYRDQNLEQEITIDKTGGNDTLTPNTLQIRAWNKTYFHSALPWAQRGAEVTLPFNDVNYKTVSEVKNPDGTTNPLDGPLTSSTGQLFTSGAASQIQNIESVGAPTINELRKAYRLQEWLENNARGGARYIEQIMSHFGVKSSDARLQRPEYLGGGKTDVVISTTYNNTGVVTEGVDPSGAVQGNMSGNATSIGKTNSFKRSFEEHGMIIGLMSVMSYPSYWQGLRREWTRFEKLDFPFPEFANLGEQAIKNEELFLTTDVADDDATNNGTFGYTPRYAEFKTGFNSIHGDFKDTLDFWHYAQKYDALPPLNANFMKYENDNRIWNVIDQDIDNLYIQVYNRVSAIRPLPYFGTPRT